MAIPDCSELKRLTEAVTELQKTVRAAIQAASNDSADVEQRCEQARADVLGTVRNWLGQERLSAFRVSNSEPPEPTLRIGYRAEWGSAIGMRMLVTGVAPARHAGGDADIIYVHGPSFDALATAYIVERGLKLDGLSDRFRYKAFQAIMKSDGLSATAISVLETGCDRPKTNLPAKLIREYLEHQKSEGRIPAQTDAVEELRQKYRKHIVTREPVRVAHRAVFPNLRRGRR